MGIYTALYTSVGGLRAQAYALEQISGNIANSQTTGYKRTDTAFEDLVTDSLPTAQDAAGVRAFSRPTNDLQGDISGVANSTFMAINGSGMFIVGQKTGEVDGRSIFDGLDLYTRRGDFERDAEGYLRNGAGYFLKGIEIDPATGNPVGSSPDLIQVTNDLLPASPTTQVNYRANLPGFPLTADADPDVAGSELLDPASFVNDPTAGNDEFVQAVDNSRFLNASVSGGGVTAYMPSGASVNVQLRWAKTDATLGSETWNLFYLEDSTATGASPSWRNTGQNFVFDSSGALTTPATNNITVAGLTVDGNNLGSVRLDFGTGGLTQFDDANGTVKVTDLSQNGYPAGEFAGLSISDDGRVVASYANGRSVDVAQVTLASFSAPNRLQKMDGGAFMATADSGVAVLDAPGTIIASALEASNTDIADEFSKLIVTQQAYSSNARIITTADEMMDEVLNIVR